MNETELVTKSAEKIHKQFPYMKLSEAIKNIMGDCKKQQNGKRRG